MDLHTPTVGVPVDDPQYFFLLLRVDSESGESLAHAAVRTHRRFIVFARKSRETGVRFSA